VTVTDLQDPPAAFDDHGYEHLARFSNGVSLWYRGHYSETDRHIAAVNGGLIGHFLWDRVSGRVSAVHVHPSFRRRGLATQMLNMAVALSASDGVPPPARSDNMSSDGAAWADSVTEGADDDQ